jgi:hypothetical protein
MQVFDDRFQQCQDGTSLQFRPDSAWIISASGWLFKKKYITMQGSINVNKYPILYGIV